MLPGKPLLGECRVCQSKEFPLNQPDAPVFADSLVWNGGGGLC